MITIKQCFTPILRKLLPILELSFIGFILTNGQEKLLVDRVKSRSNLIQFPQEICLFVVSCCLVERRILVMLLLRLVLTIFISIRAVIGTLVNLKLLLWSKILQRSRVLLVILLLAPDSS